jgi:F-type H+-transporting ATPase subunit gamma
VATQRDIKNRIVSIKNTKKITSTMEMVSTSKMKKMQGRLEKSKPYEEKVNHIIADLLAFGGSGFNDPLLKEIANPTRALIFQITGNRGLCGSFNANVTSKTMELKDKLELEGKEAQIYVVGKKGINFYNFINQRLFRTAPNPEDKFTFDEAAKIGAELTNFFLSGEFHEIYISYTKVLSSASQKSEVIKLLPIAPMVEEQTDVLPPTSTDYYFEPNPAKIFSYILPLYIKVKLFTCFLESGFSEQFARRVAMKNATDASSEMIRELTVRYNRARQAKITNEIAEIVGGAAALE